MKTQTTQHTEKGEHTPTPWQINMWAANQKGIRIHQQDEQPIAPLATVHVYGTEYSDQEKANAEFIIRAVNNHETLLYALKSAQRAIKYMASQGQYFDDLDHEMGLEGRIDQAIAQAEGK